MKIILACIACAIVVTATGCTTRAGTSLSHEGHSHGVTAKGSTEGGVSAGARVY
jgi:hypothetical protein